MTDLGKAIFNTSSIATDPSVLPPVHVIFRPWENFTHILLETLFEEHCFPKWSRPQVNLQGKFLSLVYNIEMRDLLNFQPSCFLQ